MKFVTELPKPEPVCLVSLRVEHPRKSVGIVVSINGQEWTVAEFMGNKLMIHDHALESVGLKPEHEGLGP